MRLLILSDIHADAAGLEQVLLHAEQENWQALVLLGDLIGYGPEPAATLALLGRQETVVSIGGNHEHMLGQLRGGRLPQVAPQVRDALQLCLDQLSPAQLDGLGALPAGHMNGRWQAAHGHPGRNRFDYLLGSADARRAEQFLQADLCLIGHSHLPGMLLRSDDGRWTARPARLEAHDWRIARGAKAFLNPGSTFQNRDGTPDRSYGILDLSSESETVFSVRRLTRD